MLHSCRQRLAENTRFLVNLKPVLSFLFPLIAVVIRAHALRHRGTEKQRRFFIDRKLRLGISLNESRMVYRGIKRNRNVIPNFAFPWRYLLRVRFAPLSNAFKRVIRLVAFESWSPRLVLAL